MTDIKKYDKNSKSKESAQKILTLLDDQQTLKEIEQVCEVYEPFISISRALERHEMVLKRSVDLVESLRVIINDGYASGTVSITIKNKFREVFSKNQGYMEIKALVKDQNITGNLKKLSENEILLVLSGPATSSDVERAFSVYKAMLRPNRNRFEISNFKQHLIPRLHFNRLKVKAK